MKLFALVLLLIFILLQYGLWLGKGGIPEVRQLEQEVSEVKGQVERLRERNQALDAEVNDLKTGLDAIEERARSELGMIGKDETYFQLIDNRNATEPTDNASPQAEN